MPFESPFRSPNPLAYPAGIAPGFNPSHPASRSMTNGKGFLAVPIAGTFVNLLNCKTFGTAGSPAAALLNIGPCVNFPSTSATSVCTITGQSTATSSLLTMAAIVSLTSNGSAYQSIVQAGSGSGGQNSGILAVNSGLIELYFNGGNASTLAVATSTPYFLAASAVSASTINYVVANLRTGTIARQTISTARGINAPGSTQQIGNSNNTSQETQGFVAAAMYSQSYLTMPQLLAWAADPWTFWYPRNMTNRIGRGFPWWAMQNNLPVIGAGTY